jgi:hypothetical protein
MTAGFGRRRGMPTIGRPTTWSSALDRFARSVHRYTDRVVVVHDRALRDELLRSGATLTDVLHATLDYGHARSPLRRCESADVVRALLRSGTLCAHATEQASAAIEASRHGDQEELVRCMDGVRAAVLDLVRELDAVGISSAA